MNIMAIAREKSKKNCEHAIADVTDKTSASVGALAFGLFYLGHFCLFLGNVDVLGTNFLKRNTRS